MNDNKELFVGNTRRDSGHVEELRKLGVTSARMAEGAVDIDGKPLPPEYAQVIISTADAGKYDDVMMTRTFGANWRRRVSR